MWTLNNPKIWSMQRKASSKCPEGGLPPCGRFHACRCSHCPPCSIPSPPCNQSSMASKFEPNAPPLPPEAEFSEEWGRVCHHEHQPLMHGHAHGIEPGSSSGYGSLQSPMPYGQTSSYQQYVLPSPAYGVPVWQDMRPEWSTGLCHCGADLLTCLLGCFCPCILFGKVAEKLDNGTTSCLTASIVWYLLQQFLACGCIYSCGFRRKLRAKYDLPETPCPDCVVHCLCWPCAFCQEYRELHVRSRREEAWASRPIVTPPQQQSMSY